LDFLFARGKRLRLPRSSAPTLFPGEHEVSQVDRNAVYAPSLSATAAGHSTILEGDSSSVGLKMVVPGQRVNSFRNDSLS